MKNLIALAVAALTLSGCASLNRISQTTACGMYGGSHCGKGVPSHDYVPDSQKAEAGLTKIEVEKVGNIEDGTVFRVKSDEYPKPPTKLILTERFCSIYNGTASIRYSEFGTDNALIQGYTTCRVLDVQTAG